MASYGTIMIGNLAAGKTIEDWRKDLEDWQRERNVPGFQGEYTLLADDGRVVSCVIFESKDAYQKLGQDPEQDKWWQERTAKLLDGEPEWIDGAWV